MDRDVMEARARVRATEQGVKVIPAGRGQWVAPSASQPDTAYLLTLDSFGRPRCTCPGYSWRLCCKHSEALRMLLARQTSTGSLRSLEDLYR